MTNIFHIDADGTRWIDIDDVDTLIHEKYRYEDMKSKRFDDLKSFFSFINMSMLLLKTYFIHSLLFRTNLRPKSNDIHI